MIGLLITVVVISIAVALFLAPVEALGWWAGWYGEALAPARKERSLRYDRYAEPAETTGFVVFLDGIAKVGDENYQDVTNLLTRLSTDLPGVVVLGDVMPYSVRNLGLLDGRPLAWFWRLAYRLKLEGRQPLINFTINVRNLMQVLVAADRRYAPIYGHGEAQVILDSLVAHGYVPGSGTPVTFIGYSGGAQIAIVTAPFLKQALQAPLRLISLGGVFTSDRGLLSLERIDHIQGTNDIVPDIAVFMAPGRWRISGHSAWNTLKRKRRYHYHDAGPVKHSGPGSYLDGSRGYEGVSYLERTIRQLKEILLRS